MNAKSNVVQRLPFLPPMRRSLYDITLTADDDTAVEYQIRAVATQRRGDLLNLRRHGQRRLCIRLGARRIDDIVTALEAAGFDIACVMMIQSPQPNCA